MKKLLAMLAIAVVLVSAWLIHAKLSARRAEVKRLQAQRDGAYQAQLAKVQHDLPLGTPRAEVEQYLDSRNALHSKGSWDIDLQIGQDPGDGIVCNYWMVFVALKFSHLKDQAIPSPLDNLSSISVEKRGHCL